MPPKRATAAAAAVSTKRSKLRLATAVASDSPHSSSFSSTSSPRASDGDGSDSTESEQSELGDSSDADMHSLSADNTAVDGHDWQDSTPFRSDDCQRSLFPIFRRRDIVVRTPCESRTAHELANMTFAQYMDYFLSHPSFARQAAHLVSDERYMCLLELCTRKQTVAAYCAENKVSEPTRKWMYAVLKHNTVKYVIMEYAGKDVSEIDKGPVLVCFMEPDPLSATGQVFIARPPSSSSELTIGTMRRVVPVSQIVQVLEYCHRGELGVAHYGQDRCSNLCDRYFFGITRKLARLYPARCAVCQQKQAKQHKAKLVPILAKSLFERIVIDLLDYSRKASHGYKWILHACDHFSKYHWVFAMLNKEAATVAHHLEMLLQQTGPVQIIQSDNGTEFLGEVGGHPGELGHGWRGQQFTIPPADAGHHRALQPRCEGGVESVDGAGE